MTEQEFRQFGRDCFAVFNARPPERDSPAWRIWAGMCERVDLAAAPWVRARIADMDALPRNFGKAVYGLWRDWRSETGQGYEARQCCRECEPSTPGFFYCFRRDGNGRIHATQAKCACNNDPAFAHMRPLTRRQAREIGLAVMPVGHPGGWGAYMAKLMGREQGKKRNRDLQGQNALAP